MQNFLIRALLTKGGANSHGCQPFFSRDQRVGSAKEIIGSLQLSFHIYLYKEPHANVLQSYDGWNHYQPPYEPPKFNGELPKFEGGGLKVYTGNCHCGAVTLAVKTKPFPEVEVKEDNCSICQRVSPHYLAFIRNTCRNPHRLLLYFSSHYLCPMTNDL